MRKVYNSSGNGVAGTLDSSYYKGQGLRQGIEREYIVIYELGRHTDSSDIDEEQCERSTADAG